VTPVIRETWFFLLEGYIEKKNKSKKKQKNKDQIRKNT